MLGIRPVHEKAGQKEDEDDAELAEEQSERFWRRQSSRPRMADHHRDNGDATQNVKGSQDCDREVQTLRGIESNGGISIFNRDRFCAVASLRYRLRSAVS
jgi:hypothetical protein